MKVVLAEPLLRAYLADLEAATGNVHDWRWSDGVDADVLADVDVLVGGELPAEVAAKSGRLRLVQAPGAGYEGIAMDALPPGVAVANTFHHGRSIAEHVVLVTLALTRRLRRTDTELRAGRWLSPRFDNDLGRPDTLRDKTMGVIGLGEIGSEVVRLSRAFDMRCIAVRRHAGRGSPPDLDLAWLGGVETLGQLCAEADVVVVTVPHSVETAGLVGRAEIAAMKPDALLVNVARGPVVDENALYDALVDNRIGGAALDVWWRYPDASGIGSPSTAPFGDLDNVVMTPHVSGVTTETFALRVADIAGNINRLADGAPLVNVVRGT
ncbi:MAG TPA: 2-hydroxyacid dehydrogenase [Actinopolymorphaceae bacterium]|nr:2-hydroxyacid dehydrogenase [Actinopolymorphaceae bacterium]